MPTSPYRLHQLPRPGTELEIEVVAEDGGRALLRGTFDGAQELAGNVVLRMRVVQARVTPLPARA